MAAPGSSSWLIDCLRRHLPAGIAPDPVPLRESLEGRLTDTRRPRGKRHALPSLVSGLRLAWPAALIGAIIGEWFGASRGIGILIINAMQNFQIVLLWCAVLLAVAASLFFYGLLTLLERAAYARFG